MCSLTLDLTYLHKVAEFHSGSPSRSSHGHLGFDNVRMHCTHIPLP